MPSALSYFLLIEDPITLSPILKSKLSHWMIYFTFQYKPFLTPLCHDEFGVSICSFLTFVILVWFEQVFVNWSDWRGSIMQSDWQSCPRIQSRVVRVNCVMDSGNSSCSRTRSGLVRRKGIFAPSKASCSRTRSGLVRIKSFVHSRDGSSSRTRSGLIRIKSFVDSSDSSCSRTRSDPVSGSPQVVEVCNFLILHP